jgi:outer membrane usher protein
MNNDNQQVAALSFTHASLRQSTLVNCCRTLLCLFVSAVLADWAGGAYAADSDVSFDSHFLPDANSSNISLTRFDHANVVTPGSYQTEVYLNNAWSGNTSVRFFAPSATASAVPCVDVHLLELLNLHPTGLSEKTLSLLKDPMACVDIDALIPQATLYFNLPKLRLDVSVPQAYLSLMPRGYVSPEYWDAGVPAAMLNYTFNGYHNTSEGQDQSSAYLGLNGGVNLGLWHLRHDSTASWLSATGNTPARRRWYNIDTYVQRAIPFLRSKVTFGDSYTDGAVFDSIGLRGVVMASDDSMLPSSERSYAPVVQGSAYTSAKVTVRQSGVLIYQTTVAPGPFILRDLNPTGFGSNLDVTITEADGRVRTFSVAYSSVAQLVHPDVTRYSVAVGQLRNVSLSHEPDVAVATLQHGFSNLLTGYTGVEGFQGYLSAQIGAAFNTPVGAMALDVTQANTRIPGYENQSGQSVRLSYSKILPETDTSLTVAAYRYSTRGYLSLSDAAVARDYADRQLNAFTDYVPPDAMADGSILTPAQQAALSGSRYVPLLQITGLQRQRDRFSVSLNQRLGQNWGYLYANASISDYWNASGTDTQYQVGYSNSFRSLSYSVSAMRTQTWGGRNDNTITMNLSIPLGSSTHSPNLSLNLADDKNSGSQTQAMLNGSLGDDNQFNYNLAAMHSAGSGTSSSLSGGYDSPYAQFNSSIAQGHGYSQETLGLSGSVVAHPGGITLGQSVSPNSAIGVVEAPGAAGARISSASGVRVGAFGYAVVPYLTPYTMNTVSIDPKGLPFSVQLNETSKKVAPYAGSVVMLKFKTENGRALVVRSHLSSGQVPPLGASVFSDKGTSLGVVGQQGGMLIRGVDDAGRIVVRWESAEGKAQSCYFDYQLSTKSSANRYQQITTLCLQ